MDKIDDTSLRAIIERFFDRVGGCIPPDDDDADNQRIRRRTILLTDHTYAPVDTGVLDSLLTSDVNLIVPNNPNLPDNDDCDDYALYLKAMMAVRARATGAAAGETVFPPAVGMVISQTHVTNLVVGLTGSGNPYCGVIDASAADRTLERSAEKVKSLLGTLPLKLVYV